MVVDSQESYNAGDRQTAFVSPTPKKLLTNFLHGNNPVGRLGKPVKLDRIAVDILNWLRSLLFKKRDLPNYSLSVIQSISGDYGLSQQVRRETQRAVSTWVFTPNKADVKPSEQKRYFLCLDSLSPDERDYRHTHRISIYRAGVWSSIDDEGFNADQLYTGIFNLSGTGGYSDRWGCAVIKNFAVLLSQVGCGRFDNASDSWQAWENEVRLSISHVIGTYQTPSPG